MKKLILFVVCLIGMSFFTLGQENSTSPEIFIGVSEIIHNTSGDAMNFSGNFSTNFNLGVRVYISPKISLKAEYTKDNWKLGNWKLTSDFGFYSYNLATEYNIMNNLTAFAQIDYFTDQKNKINKYGWEIGIKTRSNWTKHLFGDLSVSYLRVTDFIIPKNTVKLTGMIGYKF